MLSNMLYYFLCASPVLIYGIGLNREVTLAASGSAQLLSFFKMLICVSASSALSFLVAHFMLASAHLSDIYPFICVLIFALISVFVESIIRITVHTSVAEFSVSLLCVLLGTGESLSVAECVVTSCLSCCAFFLLMPFLRAVLRRTELSGVPPVSRNASLAFISLAVFVLALLVWNVSWIGKGVFR